MESFNIQEIVPWISLLISGLAFWISYKSYRLSKSARTISIAVRTYVTTLNLNGLDQTRIAVKVVNCGTRVATINEVGWECSDGIFSSLNLPAGKTLDLYHSFDLPITLEDGGSAVYHFDPKLLMEEIVRFTGPSGYKLIFWFFIRGLRCRVTSSIGEAVLEKLDKRAANFLFKNAKKLPGAI